MEKNSYFENLMEKAEAYWELQKLQEVQYPFTAGEALALGEYNHCQRSGADTFEVSSVPMEDEIGDFAKTLEAAGVESFTITSDSSALLVNFYRLDGLGWHFKGLRTVTRENEHNYGSKEPVTRRGLQFVHR